jgi:RNA polymerase sigma factor (sigma-70 family)
MTSDSVMSADSSRLAAFEQHRRLLFSIAYRMLGSVAEAEDMLQDAFIRWQRASEVEIRSPKAFLVTIVSRLCINHLQSARVQRERYVGEWLPEPLVTEPGSNAAEILQVDESVSMALLLLLERLTPEERAVFLLHEVFDYKHAEIAPAESDRRQLPAAATAGPTTCSSDAPSLQGADRGSCGAARRLLSRGRQWRYGPPARPAVQ